MKNKKIEKEKGLKKGLLKHIAKDDKEFRSQISDDEKMKKVIKKKLR